MGGCTKCRYSTCCSRAMSTHIGLVHASNNPTYDLGALSLLNSDMYCEDGFKTTSGNKLASYLARNGFQTAYPNEGSVKEARERGEFQQESACLSDEEYEESKNDVNDNVESPMTTDPEKDVVNDGEEVHENVTQEKVLENDEQNGDIEEISEVPEDNKRNNEEENVATEPNTIGGNNDVTEDGVSNTESLTNANQDDDNTENNDMGDGNLMQDTSNQEKIDAANDESNQDPSPKDTEMDQ